MAHTTNKKTKMVRLWEKTYRQVKDIAIDKEITISEVIELLLKANI